MSQLHCAERATAHEAAAVQRTGSAGPPGAVERSGSASDFGSFTDGGRPAGGGRAGDPFAASGELGFEFVDPPAGAHDVPVLLQHKQAAFSRLDGGSQSSFCICVAIDNLCCACQQALMLARLRQITSRCSRGQHCQRARPSPRPSSAASPATARRRPSAGCPSSARQTSNSRQRRRSTCQLGTVGRWSNELPLYAAGFAQERSRVMRTGQSLPHRCPMFGELVLHRPHHASREHCSRCDAGEAGAAAALVPGAGLGSAATGAQCSAAGGRDC